MGYFDHPYVPTIKPQGCTGWSPEKVEKWPSGGPKTAQNRQKTSAFMGRVESTAATFGLPFCPFLAHDGPQNALVGSSFCRLGKSDFDPQTEFDPKSDIDTKADFDPKSDPTDGISVPNQSIISQIKVWCPLQPGPGTGRPLGCQTPCRDLGDTGRGNSGSKGRRVY